MKQNKTNLILILSILLLLISGFFSYYFFNIIKNKNKHISAVNASLSEKITEKENIDVLEKKMVELGDMSSRVEGYLVDPSKIDTFVNYLESLGVKNNIDLSVRSVEITKNIKNRISFSIEMKGSFENITKIINLLENAPYNITIDSTSINKEMPSSNNTSQGDVTQSDSSSYWHSTLDFTVLSL